MSEITTAELVRDARRWADMHESSVYQKVAVSWVRRLADALDQPVRSEAEVRAEALEEAADEAREIHCGYPTNLSIRSLQAIKRWLRARAAAERGGA